MPKSCASSASICRSRNGAAEEGIADEELRKRIGDAADRKMAEKAANFGPDSMRMIERSLLLQLLDQIWKEHLLGLDHMRQGIGLRAYAQRDPLNEYKREAFALFEEMLGLLRERVTALLSRVELRVQPSEEELTPQPPRQMVESREDPAFAEAATAARDAQANQGQARVSRRPEVNAADPSTWAATPRNAPCPCGSGKKYKHCHGAVV